MVGVGIGGEGGSIKGRGRNVDYSIIYGSRESSVNCLG